jgi:hypothetical protein
VVSLRLTRHIFRTVSFYSYNQHSSISYSMACMTVVMVWVQESRFSTSFWRSKVVYSTYCRTELDQITRLERNAPLQNDDQPTSLHSHDFAFRISLHDTVRSVSSSISRTNSSR